MGLSIAFDCIPRDLRIAKLYAYGLRFDTITFLNSYLKDRKQNARINNIYSASKTFDQVYHKVLNYVRSFSIYFSMACFFELKSQTYIILSMIIPSPPHVTLVTHVTGLLKTLEQESESAVSWFKQNEILVIAAKFQAIILNKKK